MTTRRRRYWPTPVMETIEGMISEGYSAKQIREYLESELEGQKKLPDVRTIQRMISEHDHADETGPWEIGPAADIDPGAALAVLGEVMALTEGRVSQLSKAEARWVSTLRMVWGDLPSYHLYGLARLYIWRRHRKETTADLDAFLAFAPWREPQAKRYMREVQEGRLPEPPLFLWALVPGTAPRAGSFTPRPLLKLTGDEAAKFEEQLERAQREEAENDSQD